MPMHHELCPPTGVQWLEATVRTTSYRGHVWDWMPGPTPTPHGGYLCTGNYNVVVHIPRAPLAADTNATYGVRSQRGGPCPGGLMP